MKSRIIENLMSSPSANTDGEAFELLNEFLTGLPLEELTPLLQSGNASIRKTAAFICSELGKDSLPILSHIKPLLSDEDHFTRWYALEAIASISADSAPSEYATVLAGLTDTHQGSAC